MYCKVKWLHHHCTCTAPDKPTHVWHLQHALTPPPVCIWPPRVASSTAGGGVLSHAVTRFGRPSTLSLTATEARRLFEVEKELRLFGALPRCR